MTLSGFDTRLDLFQQRPLERLRYAVTEANLLRHLDPAPQRVLDVAGGNGVEAVRLAALGHEVTVLDPAGAMLHRAIETAESQDVADRLHVVQAGALDAPEVLGGHEFDLVLCHNLLHFVDDRDDRHEVLAAVTAPLREGGLLSILGPNADFDPLHAVVREFDPDQAVHALSGEREAPAAELIALLAGVGFAEVVRYGVRCAADLVDLARVEDPVFLADLTRLEVAMADRMPQLLTARYFHLVARR
ncbi:class I SAM-dependent methyltransferase [Actinophytocola gossypii]|uniref:Methyltransferase domain-containing protein n=1 Tax=Actinophytocola gossypii TaxID=2812003 RepID=A0ABT2J975_9PSEU|nr:methyltransferase domain-containing protein [Actinophytocola gossypii]MCT2584005.1 methyltransferase domain-containing protein [Actinophytocola gossypii]